MHIYPHHSQYITYAYIYIYYLVIEAEFMASKVEMTPLFALATLPNANTVSSFCIYVC
jgi:hypothetical protein